VRKLLKCVKFVTSNKNKMGSKVTYLSCITNIFLSPDCYGIIDNNLYVNEHSYRHNTAIKKKAVMNQWWWGLQSICDRYFSRI